MATKCNKKLEKEIGKMYLLLKLVSSYSTLPLLLFVFKLTAKVFPEIENRMMVHYYKNIKKIHIIIIDLNT